MGIYSRQGKRCFFYLAELGGGTTNIPRGHIFRVGTGESINIWEDHWILDSPTRMVLTQKGNSLLRHVNELIDPITEEWDEDLLRHIFLPVDVERILRIPLSPLLEDFVAWNGTKSHTFSVRSAYYIEWEHQYGARVRGEVASTAGTNPVWDILWKLQVPSKVKKFVWRALHGTVPGMCILNNRHIKVNPQCPVCKSGPEDIRHLIFTCTRAKEVWGKLGLLEDINLALCVDRSGSVVLEELLTNPLKKSPVLG